MWWGADENDLLNTLDEILGRLEDADLFAAAHEYLFFDTSRGVARCTRGDRCLTIGSV